MYEVSVSASFVGKRNEIASDSMRSKIDAMLVTLSSMPRFGSTLVSERLVDRFGEGVRKASVPPFQILYELDDTAHVVRVLDLVYTPAIR